MIWEDQPLPEVVTRLGEMGIRSLVFRPCGNRPASGDFFSIMAESVLSLGQTPATPSS
jgi:zinc transport system substrate-binding protein